MCIGDKENLFGTFWWQKEVGILVFAQITKTLRSICRINAHFTPVFSCMSWVLGNVLKEIYQFSNIFVNPIKVKSPHIHRSYLPWTQHSPPFTVHSMYYILMIMRSLCNFTQSMFWYPPWQYMHCIDLCLSCQLLPCVQSLVCNVFYELQCALCKVQSRLCNMHCTICTVQ